MSGVYSYVMQKVFQDVRILTCVAINYDFYDFRFFLVIGKKHAVRSASTYNRPDFNLIRYNYVRPS